MQDYGLKRIVESHNADLLAHFNAAVAQCIVHTLGNVIVAGRDSKSNSLFDPTVATFEDDAGGSCGQECRCRLRGGDASPDDDIERL